MALEKANITNGYVYGPGGLVELDADGNPNGIFREQASKIYDNLIPDPFLVPSVTFLENPQYKYAPSSASITYHISFFPNSFSLEKAYSSSG